jgi:thiol-disulfide isomerase/thioredoxin
MDSAVASLRKEGFRITGINVRNDPGAAQRYEVRRLPTFIYFDEQRQEVRRTSGNMSTSSLRQMWRKPIF